MSFWNETLRVELEASWWFSGVLDIEDIEALLYQEGDDLMVLTRWGLNLEINIVFDAVVIFCWTNSWWKNYILIIDL